MSPIDIFPANPPKWPSNPGEIAPKVEAAYQNLKPCTTVHPTIAKLGIAEPLGFRSIAPLTVSGVDLSDALVLPINNSDGSLLNLLFVSELSDGTVEEASIPGIPLNGGYVPLGKMTGNVIYLAAGMSSSLVVASATGAPVACTLYTDNLSDVAAALHHRFPDKEVIVCAGISSGEDRAIAVHAAASIGAKLAVAETGDTFFDCHREVGAEGIIRSLEAAEVPDGFDMLVEQPNPLDPPEPTRWPGKTNASLTAQHAVMLIQRRLVIDVYAAITIVLWALATYFVKDIRIAPLLAFISATKRCGKTTALGLLKSLVWRPFATSGTTAAAIYRLPKRKPTMLIDEIDTFLRSRELVGVVNSGHTRDAASITRVEKGKAVSFDTFFMKAVHLHGNLTHELHRILTHPRTPVWGGF